MLKIQFTKKTNIAKEIKKNMTNSVFGQKTNKHKTLYRSQELNLGPLALKAVA